MKSSNLFKTCVFNFVFGVSILGFVFSAMFNVILINKLQDNNNTIALLAIQSEHDKNQINTLVTALTTAENNLKVAESDLKMMQAKFDSALVPQATVKEAFVENVAKPVSSTTKAMWETVSNSSKQAWNYIFN